MSTKDEVLTVLRAQTRERKFNKLAFFEPFPKQAEFANSTNLPVREAALIAANQVGKSTIGAALMAMFLTGRYPDWYKGRRWPGPVRAWAVGESAVSTRDILQYKLCGPPGSDELLGTGMLPRDSIVSKILSHGAGGSIDLIKVKHVSGGISELAFKSYEMGASKLQGADLDIVQADEEPPMDIYTELATRTAARSGLVLATFTPLKGVSGVVGRYRERNAEAMAQRTVTKMTIFDKGNFDDEAKRNAQLASYAEHERDARARGIPKLGSGAVFEDVELESLLVPLRVQGEDIVHASIGPLATNSWAKLWSIDFGIAHPFAATLLAHDRDYDVIYVLAELKIKGGVPAIHAARMRSIAANVKVAFPHDGAAREKGSGEQLSQLYKDAGLLMMAQHATFAKGGYSTEAGIQEMLARMRSGRFKVAAGCTEWQDEFLSYHRKDGIIVKEFDDLMSATRIGVMQIRSAQPVVLGSTMRTARPQSTIAKGVDFDLFDPWGENKRDFDDR